MAAAKTEDVKLTSIRYPGEDLGIWTVLRGFFVIVSLLLMLVGLTNGSGGAIVVSLLMLTLLLPYTNIKLKERMGFGITRGLKILLLSVLFFVMAVSFSGSEDREDTKSSSEIITTPIDSFFPQRSEIPTEYVMGDVQAIKKDESKATNSTGFETGKLLFISKSNGFTRTEVAFKIYKFDTTEDANSYYLKAVDELKNKGGYTEISVNARCFAYEKEGSMLDTGSSICLKQNIILETKTIGIGVDSITKDMSKLVYQKIK